MPGPGGIALGLSRVNCSLNFRVPAYYCRRGRMHVAVRIWRVGAGALQDSQVSAAVVQYVQFLDVRPPRIALVRVNWDNGLGTVTSPSDVEMLRRIRLAERMLPFPYQSGLKDILLNYAGIWEGLRERASGRPGD